MSQVANMYNPNLAPGAPGIPGYPGQLQAPVPPPFPLYQFNAPAYSAQPESTDLLHVKGTEGAKMFTIGRNCRVPLFDEDDDYVYIKKSDSNGVVSCRKFRLIEEPFDAPSTNQNGVEFVTMDEFKRFKEEILNGQQTISATNSASIVSNAADSSAESDAKSNVSGKRRTANG